MRQLRDNVRRGGRDDQRVNSLRDRNVFDGALDIGRRLAPKKLGDDFLAGERGKGKRRHKFLSAPGHHDLNFYGFLLQPSHQLGCFVSRYSAANAERDAHA